MVIPRLRGVVEDASCDDDDGADFVYVAIGKSVEKSASLLRWTFRRFRDKQIRLLHVHHLSSVIPTLREFLLDSMLFLQNLLIPDPNRCPIAVSL